MIPPFETTFAVPLNCESCISEISTSLHKLDGIKQTTFSLPAQTLTTTGTTPPSLIVHTIQQTGRDAILRGTGDASNSAAVCILETHCPSPSSPDGTSTSTSTSTSPVRGLARMVQVSPSMTVIDLTVKGLAAGRYAVTVRETGDVSRGAGSVGGVWSESCVVPRDSEDGNGEQSAPVGKKGVLGAIEVDESGGGSVFLDRPVRVWEMIGRGMVVSKVRSEEEEGGDEDAIVGVIARSAGLWENEKTVCSCSGKTVWEEREEQRGKGIL